ncbi:MAG TPA: DUF5652 family protein [Candidatus Paceibacterota bacterium]|nr:DUF5652 family protein [Candidatus Paceibacterota bacterium]
MHWLYQNGWNGMDMLGIGALAVFLPILVLWSIGWKGWALWLAARRHEPVWFVVLLIVNTLGILEIIYIFGIAKRKDHKEERPTTTAGSV